MVRRHSGLRPEKIRSESRLLQDLGIDGDDAEYLLVEFFERFDVDMSNFNFRRFFMGEPQLFNFLKFGDKERLMPLTVDDLCRSAAARKIRSRKFVSKRVLCATFL